MSISYLHKSGLSSNKNTLIANLLTAMLGTPNHWLAQQTPMGNALVIDANNVVAWDANVSGQSIDLVLTTNVTMAPVSNIVKKNVYVMRVSQDSVGNRVITWDASYVFGPNGAPLLTLLSNSVDWLQFEGGSNNTLEFVGIRNNAV
jgi:hypothetical protein